MNEHRNSTPPRPTVTGSRIVPLAALGLGLLVGYVSGAPAIGVRPAESDVQIPPPPIRLELPREYRYWLPKPIRFDHMYREADPVRAR